MEWRVAFLMAWSIQIDASWSARVYQDANRQSPSWCFTGSDPDFRDNRFENGGPLDNTLSAVEIFSQPTCPSLPVCAPALILNCGQTHDYDTTGWGSTDQIDTYWCSPYPETGREVAYAFTPDRLHRVSLTLTLPVDLDLFVIDGWLGSCSTGACIVGQAHSEARRRRSPRGRGTRTISSWKVMTEKRALTP